MKMCSEEGRGRFLVASQPIQAGETVCASPPYCRAVTGSMKRIVCSHCYRASTNRLPFQCERCHEVSFCSDQCSVEGIKRHLPHECNALKKMNRTRGRDVIDLDDVRVLISMLNQRFLENNRSRAADQEKAINETSEQTKTTSTECIQLATLSSTEEQHGKEATTDVSLAEGLQAPQTTSTNHVALELNFTEDIAILVGEYDMLPNTLEKRLMDEASLFLFRILDEPLKAGVDLEEIKRLFCKSRFNRFGKWSKKGTAMGFGVFPWVSYFNHSCIPNLRRYQGDDFGMLEVRAIRAIEAGEELCISYTDLHFTTEDRRAVLKDYFGFTCMCQRCTDMTEESDNFIEARMCPTRLCQELLLPLKEYNCEMLHCRCCGLIKAKRHLFFTRNNELLFLNENPFQQKL